MPFSPAYFGEKFGMVTGKFEIKWCVNGNMEPDAAGGVWQTWYRRLNKTIWVD